MSYDIRVLGTELDPPTLEQVRGIASPALVEKLKETSSTWTQLILKHESGEEIALVERNETDEGLGADELAEFIEEVGTCRPVNAADWLKAGSVDRPQGRRAL